MWDKLLQIIMADPITDLLIIDFAGFPDYKTLTIELQSELEITAGHPTKMMTE